MARVYWLVTKMMQMLLATIMALASFGAHSTPARSAPTVAAVGDIACSPTEPVTATTCRQAAVADAIAATNPDSVWLLGDNQYSVGRLGAYQQSFGPAFGRFAPIWRPAPGNHEYGTPGAAGYFDYFGAAAGPDRRGYYSFNIGSWHVVSLNSNCEVISCASNSAQAAWLRADLKANKRLCTAAYWHHPLYSSGSEHGSDPRSRPLWKILENRRAEFVLNGHDHDFEVFRPQDASGRLNRSHGMAEFVVGTGGKSAYPFGKAIPNSVVRKTNLYGFISMRLARGSYSWRFIDERNHVRSTGGASCH